MKIVHYQEIPPEPVQSDGAEGVSIRWLISEKDGAPHFAMRLFEIEAGGQTPFHTHSNEHEVFILEGSGSVWRDGAEVAVTPGTAVYVPPNEKHTFRNTGHAVMKMLCLIPHGK